MNSYKPPISEILFALKHIADIDSLSDIEAFTEIDHQELETLLEEAGRFVASEVEPTDRVGDLQGATLEADGTVQLPDGFKETYKKYVEAGWGTLPFSSEWGGGGFPWALGLAIAEMLTSANLAFSLCPMLTQGSIHMLAAHGSEEQKAFWLPKLISGQWTGTMNLTEPNAGSDVGALTARAEAQEDGTYRLFGQKIFITYGEHELSENIVHLVLARVAGAPPGTRGISCFIVPKYIPDADNAKNDIACLSIEKKLGIHASPTCILEYGGSGAGVSGEGVSGKGAVGYLIGEENQGMVYMFTMMNNARLGVGLEGLAIAERVYQKSLNYATQRLQGRRADTEKGNQTPIINHPDVRRSLLTIKSLTDAMRYLVYYNAAALDNCSQTDKDKQMAAEELAQILTPITKAWCTDMGIEIASLGIQIHGGAGFVEETGIAQHYRDIRIAAIYEGTNGIQAIDLATRKLPIRNGAAMEDLFSEIESLKEDLDEDLADLWQPIAEALDSARQSSKWLLGEMEAKRIDAVLAGATPYLRLLATLVAGWLMAKSANVKVDSSEQNLVFARFFCHQILPTATALKSSIMAGDEILYRYCP